jgi:hypothetical protein
MMLKPIARRRSRSTLRDLTTLRVISVFRGRPSLRQWCRSLLGATRDRER